MIEAIVTVLFNSAFLFTIGVGFFASSMFAGRFLPPRSMPKPARTSTRCTMFAERGEVDGPDTA